MVKELFETKPMIYGEYNDLAILRYMIKQKRLKYVLFGTGDNAVWFEDWMYRAYGIIPDYILDTNLKKDNINGIKAIRIDEYAEHEVNDAFVAVADEKYNEREYRDNLSNELKKKGAKIIFDATKMEYPFWPSWYAWIKSHTDELEEIIDLFKDAISKETLLSYLRVYINGEQYNGYVFPEEYKYWGLDYSYKKLFEIKKDEVILNLGGCTGDTIFQYLSNGFPFKKIISVEGNKTNCEYIKRSVSLIEEELRRRIHVDCVFIDKQKCIDQLYINEDVSLIQMDIEGNEMVALEGAKGLIMRNRPILAICVYHKMDDLVVIPRLLLEICKDYKYVLRKYPSEFLQWHQCIMQVNELVLYAIPQERCL